MDVLNGKTNSMGQSTQSWQKTHLDISSHTHVTVFKRTYPNKCQHIKTYICTQSVRFLSHLNSSSSTNDSAASTVKIKISLALGSFISHTFYELHSTTGPKVNISIPFSPQAWSINTQTRFICFQPSMFLYESCDSDEYFSPAWAESKRAIRAETSAKRSSLVLLSSPLCCIEVYLFNNNQKTSSLKLFLCFYSEENISLHSLAIKKQLLCCTTDLQMSRHIRESGSK